ncbi:PadR family transcriptional regulator [Candidatus Bathyarchaeota archaeon]|nr:PadR family transcriptional regulator [Candidatus Bathyarchaeota archaeon]
MTEAERDLIRATLRGFSRVVILWLISQKPMSGYGLVKEMKRLTGQNFHPGIIYPLLYELEERGFIAGEWTQRGRRRIKYYSITQNGTELLNRLRELFEMPVKEVLKDLIKGDSR